MSLLDPRRLFKLLCDCEKRIGTYSAPHHGAGVYIQSAACPSCATKWEAPEWTEFAVNLPHGHTDVQCAVCAADPVRCDIEKPDVVALMLYVCNPCMKSRCTLGNHGRVEVKETGKVIFPGVDPEKFKGFTDLSA